MNFQQFSKKIINRDSDILSLLDKEKDSFSNKEKLIYSRLLKNGSGNISVNEIEVLRLFINSKN